MMAELSGRVTALRHDQGTGALLSVRIENSSGDVTIYKPDAWTDALAFEECIGKRVSVRVIVTVEA